MKIIYLKFIVLTVVLTTIANTGLLGSTILKKIICPICQIHFSNIEYSANQSNFIYIDEMPEKQKLKILPNCPMCKGFFPANFNFSIKQINTMKSYLNSERFKSISKKPQYYKFSHILESISYDSYKTAKIFLKASLEFPDKSKDFLYCMKKARRNFQDSINNTHTTSERRQLVFLKIGDIYRRISKFKKASIYFKKKTIKSKVLSAKIIEAIKIVKSAIKRNDSSRQKFLSNTTLHLSIIQNDWQKFTKTLSTISNINLKNNAGETPLLTSIKLDRVAFSHKLLKSKANTNIKDFSGNSALHYACSNGNLTLVKALIKHNTKIDMLNSSNMTALQESIKIGKLNIAEFLINSKANKHVHDKFGNNLIHLLAQSQQLNTEAILSTLIASNIDLNERNNNSETPLHCFTPFGNTNQLQLLINAGANVNAKLPNGNTPLFLSNPQLVHFLIQNNSETNIKNNTGNTAFEEALINGSSELIAAFKATNLFGNKPKRILTTNGKMTVFDAIANENISTLNEILQKDLGLASFKRQYLGESPLHVAIIHNNIPAIKTLLKNNANPNQANDFRRTAIHYAAMKGTLEVLEILVQNKGNVFAVDIRGNTPLHDAAKFNNKDVYNYLLELGASPDTKNNEHKSPKMILSTTK